MATIGGFEQLVLLATLRLGPEAYAVTIRRELEERGGRNVSRGALYTVLERLESKGLLSSRMGDPLPERGGRARRYYRVTASGVNRVKSSKDQMVRLWKGLESVLGKLT